MHRLGDPPVNARRHSDGGITLKGAGTDRTVDAHTAGMLERMYLTPVTQDEVQQGTAEALHYGMEPILAAKLRKASGFSLPDLMGAPGSRRSWTRNANSSACPLWRATVISRNLFFLTSVRSRSDADRRSRLPARTGPESVFLARPSRSSRR